MTTRLLIAAAAAALLGGCAGPPAEPDLGALEAAGLPRYPGCEREIRAFIATVALARGAGDGWEIYRPALEALMDQVSDCIEDVYPDPLPVDRGERPRRRIRPMPSGT